MIDNEQNIKQLKQYANNIRCNTLKMITKAQTGHTGGCLSAIDILTILYFSVMNINPGIPNWEKRDRFVMSKGHASAALYATLAEKGYFETTILDTYDNIDSILQGHPDMKKTPGVDMSTGSLGQGISVALGMAIAAKTRKEDYRVYALMGDGELQEGQVWEAAMSASYYKINNLIAIIDRNNLQLLGPTEQNMAIEPLDVKWKAFGWEVIHSDGHDFNSLICSFNKASLIKEKPVVIISHTIKGKGVSFMEGAVDWHSRAPTSEELDKALEELN